MARTANVIARSSAHGPLCSVCLSYYRLFSFMQHFLLFAGQHTCTARCRGLDILQPTAVKAQSAGR